MPATQALEHLWVKVLGRKPECMTFRWLPEKSQERMIDLELHDVPALQVIDYIAELASAHWRVRGIDGVALQFELQAIEVADCTDDWVAVAVVDLTEKGAESLGIRPGMRSDALLARLQAYGVRVKSERHCAASFNSVTGRLVAAVSIHERNFVHSLARLANAGLLIRQP